DCTESYVDNTVVFIAAVPDSGSTFTGWTGACTGAGTCSVVMNSAKLVGATFTGGNTTGNLSLTVSTLGTGIVTGTGISCGVDCTESFPANTAVTLTAVPSGTASFTGWSGACSGVGSCLVTLNSNKSVVASFSDAQFGLQPLTVLKQGGGTGTVTGTRIICGADCTDSYANNTLVSLTAVPDFGFTFGGWTGDCSDSTICAIRMNGSKTVIATFLAPLEVMPAPPLGLTAFTSASCQSVDVSWQPVAGATSYSLYESGTSNRLYSGPATTFTQGDLIPNTGHSYTVTATLGGVTSRHSGQSPAGIASGSCATQASLKVMLVDASLDPLPNVTWIVDAGIPQLHGAMVTLDSGTHEVRAKRRSGYILGVATCSYYGTSECFLNSPSEYATTNNGLNCSGVYCTATVDVPAGGTLKVAFKYVKAPGNITANPVTDPPPCGGKASLSWTAVNGATGYNVYRSNDATGPFVQINAFPVLFPMYLDSGLTPLSTHYYSVSTLAGPIETPLTKPSLGCSSELDVMLVLDRSGSIQQSDGVEALQTAAKNLISTLNPTADGMHMGLATFSGQATLNVPLGANASAMVNVIDNLSFGSGTQIDDGLRTAINELAGPNNRPDISDVIILITDGEPTSDDCQPGVVPTLDEDHCGRLNALVEASRARDAGIDLFIVGVALDGSGRTFLPKLAPDANHYVDAQFGTLDDELKSLTSCLPQSEILSVMAPASAVCPIVLDSIVCSSRPTPGYTIQPIVWSTLALPVRDYTYEWHFNGLGPGLVEGAAPISTTTKYTSAGTKTTRVEVFFNGERLGEASCNVEIFRLPGYQEG
ncbi:MAG TPA: VWA domain-containing protein, partial [Candidatus Paceibacterota bacterium]